jgi:DNA mismatch repair protein MutS
VVAEDVLELRGCWHPVVADMLADGQRFVPNDCSMPEAERIWVLTGPNMSGKSTFLRQVALCVLLAQVGSGVPAASARIGVVDRIFTRIGAQDEIYSGQSTFMVEMVETANILHHATGRSLLVLDEVGRGTSTYDGLSLAWAILEYVHNRPGLRAKTLFATHYHELTQLAAQLESVANYNVRVSDAGGEIVFTHTIAAGGADRSYGLHVAQLAGIPRLVIQRAQEILAVLEQAAGRAPAPLPAVVRQLSMFGENSPLLAEIAALDLGAVSPLQALNLLADLQRRLKGAGDGKN